MTFQFVPASSFNERAGLFVSLTGGTNSGKTHSSLRLGRGIAGPTGKLAVLDTEGGRTLHLKKDFNFDVSLMDPPFRPERFAQAAKAAEDAGYHALVIDSFSMEWVGIGGVLDWQAQELQRMAGDDWKKQERMKMASWIKPKSAHKAMVYSLLQRRIPIIFSIRGEETIKPGEAGEKPTKLFKSITNQQFPYEVTVSFRLAQDRKGIIDLSDAKTFKMEGPHREIFRDGDLIDESHGAALEEWARGAPITRRDATMQAGDDVVPLTDRARSAAMGGMSELLAFWERLSKADKVLLKPDMDDLKRAAAQIDGVTEKDAA